MQEQEIKNLMGELNKVKERLSQEIMKNVELEKEKADLIIAATSACNKCDKLNIELQALQKLIDEAGDELPEKSETCVIYNKNVNTRIEITNEVVDHCIPVVAKLKQERNKAYKKIDNDTMAVLGFQIKIIKLKKELKEIIEENEELRSLVLDYMAICSEEE